MTASDYPKSVHSVNKWLRERGIPAKAVAGEGYYYFLDPETDDMLSNSEYNTVPIYRASFQTFGAWEKDARKAVAEAEEERERHSIPAAKEIFITNPYFKISGFLGR